MSSLKLPEALRDPMLRPLWAGLVAFIPCGMLAGLWGGFFGAILAGYVAWRYL